MSWGGVYAYPPPYCAVVCAKHLALGPHRDIDGLTFKPDYQPLKTRSWSGLRLKPDGLDH